MERWEFLRDRIGARKPSAVAVISDTLEPATRILLLGETHRNENYHSYSKWLAELMQETAGFDCVLLEAPATREVQDVLEDFRAKSWKDSIGKYPQIAQVAPEPFADAIKGRAKLLAVDMKLPRLSLFSIDYLVHATEDRNLTIASNIKNYVGRGGRCAKAILIIGSAHIDSATWSEGVKSVPQYLTALGLREFKTILAQSHREAFSPSRALRPNHYEDGSTFQKPRPCDYSFPDDNLDAEWGFRTLKPSYWKIWNGYIKLAVD